MRRAACGQDRRECGDCENKEANRYQSSRVGRCDLKEKTREGAAQSKRTGKAEEQSDCGKSERFRKNEPNDVRRASAQSNPNPDFVGALADGIGNDPVDADHGKGNRKSREYQQ